MLVFCLGRLFSFRQEDNRGQCQCKSGLKSDRTDVSGIKFYVDIFFSSLEKDRERVSFWKVCYAEWKWCLRLVCMPESVVTWENVGVACHASCPNNLSGRIKTWECWVSTEVRMWKWCCSHHVLALLLADGMNLSNLRFLDWKPEIAVLQNGWWWWCSVVVPWHTKSGGCRLCRVLFVYKF